MKEIQGNEYTGDATSAAALFKPFWALVTDFTAPYAGWIEQRPVPGGSFIKADGGRFGFVAQNPLFAPNGGALTIGSVYLVARAYLDPALDWVYATIVATGGLTYIWAQITANYGDGSYGWSQQTPVTKLKFTPTPSGLAGSFSQNPAGEQNKNVNVPIGTYVQLWPGAYVNGSQEWLFSFCCGPVTSPATSGCCSSTVPVQWVYNGGVNNAVIDPYEDFRSILYGGPCSWANILPGLGDHSTLGIAPASGSSPTTITLNAAGLAFVYTYSAPFNGDCCSPVTLTTTQQPPPGTPLSVTLISSCCCTPFGSCTTCNVTPNYLNIDTAGFFNFPQVSKTNPVTVSQVPQANPGVAGAHNCVWYSAQFQNNTSGTGQVQAKVTALLNVWTATLYWTVSNGSGGFVTVSATYTANITGSDCCSPFVAAYSSSSGVSGALLPGSILITPGCCNAGSLGSTGSIQSGGGGACNNKTTGLGKNSSSVNTGSLTIASVPLNVGDKLIVYAGTVVAGATNYAPVGSVAWGTLSLLNVIEQVVGDSTDNTALYLSKWAGTCTVAGTHDVVISLPSGNSHPMLGIAVKDYGGGGVLDATGNGTDNTGAAPTVTTSGNTAQSCNALNAGFLIANPGAITWNSPFTSGAQDVSVTVSAVTYTLTEGFDLVSSVGAFTASLTCTNHAWVGLIVGYT